jgi:hypothetical protein
MTALSALFTEPSIAPAHSYRDYVSRHRAEMAGRDRGLDSLLKGTDEVSVSPT